MADRGRGFEVAVLGGECAGAAVAYALARRRVGSVVIDVGRHDCGVTASDAIAVQGGEVADIRVALRSAERFPELQESAGSFGYFRTGGLSVALTDADTERGRARASQAAAAGLPLQWLSREETLRLEPGLSSHVLGAVYCAHDGVVDSSALARRLLAAAARFGAALRLDCGYFGIARQNGGFRVRAGRDEVAARRVVVASADALRAVARQLGVELPVRTQRRRVCITDRLPPLLRHTVNGIRQQPSGEVVLEDPAIGEEGAPGDDARTLVESVRRAAAAAARLVPGIETARIIHAPLLVSYEPADGRPAAGLLGEEVYLAVAAADQAAHCPVIGETVAEGISRNRWPENMEIWAPGRFEAVGAVTGKKVQDSTAGS